MKAGSYYDTSREMSAEEIELRKLAIKNGVDCVELTLAEFESLRHLLRDRKQYIKFPDDWQYENNNVSVRVTVRKWDPEKLVGKVARMKDSHQSYLITGSSGDNTVRVGGNWRGKEEFGKMYEVVDE